MGSIGVDRCIFPSDFTDSSINQDLIRNVKYQCTNYTFNVLFNTSFMTQTRQQIVSIAHLLFSENVRTSWTIPSPGLNKNMAVAPDCGCLSCTMSGVPVPANPSGTSRASPESKWNASTQRIHAQ